MGHTLCLPEDVSISALASHVGTGKLDIDDPISLFDYLTRSTIESILRGPDFDLPAQEIKHLPMLLEANESAPVESCWSINGLAVSSVGFMQSNSEVLTFDEDYDDNYDGTAEDVGAESVRSDPKILTLGDFGVAGDDLMNVDLPKIDFAESVYNEPNSSNGKEVTIAEDYDDDYDFIVEDRGAESVPSDFKVLTLGDFGVTRDGSMKVDLPEFDFAEGWCTMNPALATARKLQLIAIVHWSNWSSRNRCHRFRTRAPRVQIRTGDPPTTLVKPRKL